MPLGAILHQATKVSTPRIPKNREAFAHTIR
jgi:hypothetical protein